jgi:hypothetical protein
MPLVTASSLATVAGTAGLGHLPGTLRCLLSPRCDRFPVPIVPAPDIDAEHGLWTWFRIQREDLDTRDGREHFARRADAHPTGVLA